MGKPVVVLKKCIGVVNTAECCKETHNIFHLKSTTERSKNLYQSPTYCTISSFFNHICCTIFLDMFRASMSSSSGGKKIVCLQYLVSSHSVSCHTVHWLTADCSPLSIRARHCMAAYRVWRYQILYIYNFLSPEDEHIDARNMSRNIVQQMWLRNKEIVH